MQTELEARARWPPLLSPSSLYWSALAHFFQQHSSRRTGFTTSISYHFDLGLAASLALYNKLKGPITIQTP